MQVVQQGSINTTALIVPDLYVQIVPPSVSLINGVPTNVLGVVGTATWGAVGAPVTCSNMSDYEQNFGAIMPRKYDMGTAVAAAVTQGANNFRCVRVTDGTDVAATIIALTNCITFTAKYTGSTGNKVQVTVSPGSKSGTYRLTVSLPGILPEIFDNLASGLTGNAVWVAFASAINSGISTARGASNIIVATAGAGTTVPANATYALAGGTDGATTITGTVLLGVDGTNRKGMYSLRGSGSSVAMLTDCDDSATWSTQVSFGLSEGIYMIGVTPAGDTIANAVTVKNSAGIDSYAMKLLFGDWCYFNDLYNGIQRLISPQGFVAGRLANLSPQESSLNKPIYGVIGTQKSSNNQNYSIADIQTLAQAGIDLVANYAGKFCARIGHNTSSKAEINGDNYTRMTNYIAYSIGSAMSDYIGMVQSESVRAQAQAAIASFLQNMEGQDMIGDVNGGNAFSVVLDSSNNPMSRVALGYMQADVKVTYLSIIEKFLVNAEGGQSVQVSRSIVA